MPKKGGSINPARFFSLENLLFIIIVICIIVVVVLFFVGKSNENKHKQPTQSQKTQPTQSSTKYAYESNNVQPIYIVDERPSYFRWWWNEPYYYSSGPRYYDNSIHHHPPPPPPPRPPGPPGPPDRASIRIFTYYRVTKATCK